MWANGGAHCMLSDSFRHAYLMFIRTEFCEMGVHDNIRQGIGGGRFIGCPSVVLKCAYEDDEDFGREFYFTGTGRRSTMTHYKHRGILDRYRYDGLYNVVEAKTLVGKSGYLICRFKFVIQMAQAVASSARAAFPPRCRLAHARGDMAVSRILDSEGELTGTRITVAVDFRDHGLLETPRLAELQPDLTADDYVQRSAGSAVDVYPTASIVKGMTFVLLELASLDALGRLSLFPTKVRPALATGSAASCLGGWLGSKKGPGSWAIRITQGVEMGRRSEITVDATIAESGDIERIELGGNVCQVMSGDIVVPAAGDSH
ncbi:PUA-like domain-containing protein [Schizophyllum amplum]|uniref:PUA-like domain-containing protein n=1 Tax=Schizophyllum amplum TaxID=97359 RepID=A0A550C4B2_9AGAR|nr:PUA-like domain-containing protein [Auriculariopsis ampla]